METIEILRTIALLCQISVGTSGVARDHRMNSDNPQKVCQKYFAKCIHSSRPRTVTVMADDLRKCMAAR